MFIRNSKDLFYDISLNGMREIALLVLWNFFSTLTILNYTPVKFKISSFTSLETIYRPVTEWTDKEANKDVLL